MLMLLCVHVTRVLFLVPAGNFALDYGLLLELHALTLVACSYALLWYLTFHCQYCKQSNSWKHRSKGSLAQSHTQIPQLITAVGKTWEWGSAKPLYAFYKWLSLCVLLCRYNLLCEENPDEFVSVEIPSDISITSNQSVVPPSKERSPSRLVSRLRKSPTAQRRKGRMEPQQDISQVGWNKYPDSN